MMQTLHTPVRQRLSALLAGTLLTIAAQTAAAQSPADATQPAATVAAAPVVVMLGDSNTFIGGDDCLNPKGWNYWFAKRWPEARCRSYARSGATWTNTPSTRRNTEEYTGVLANDNVIYNQVERLVEACDQQRQAPPTVIIISAGTNDAWFNAQRPAAFTQTAADAFADSDSMLLRRQPAEVLTLAASVRYCCTLLRQRFPAARLVLVSPMQTTAAPDSLIHQAGDLIEACAHRLQALTIRLDKDSRVVSAQEARRKVYTTDGTHTSRRGAKYNGRLIADRVRDVGH